MMGCNARKSGQITVFLALIAGLVTSLILAEVEVARVNIIKADQKVAAMTACQSILAGYSIPLFERYDLFAVDGTSRDLNSELKSLLQANSGCGLFSADVTACAVVDEVSMTAEHYGAMKKEICQYMETAGLIDAAKALVMSLENSHIDQAEQNKELITANMQQEVQQSEQEKIVYEQQSENSSIDPQDQTTEKKVHDPRKELNALITGGLLQVVLPAGFQLSDAEITGAYSFSAYSGTGFDFTSMNSVLSQINNHQFSFATAGNLIEDQAVLPLYIRKKFKCAVGNEIHYDTKVQYEMEYLLCGHQSDRINLLDTINRIIMIRLAFNYIYLLSDIQKTTEAHTLAATLASSVLMPWAEPVIYGLLLLAWAYAESILDVRALLQGYKVSTFKTAASWRISLQNIGSSGSVNAFTSDSQGLSYMDYVSLLLLTKTTDTIYERMVQLMESNVRLASSEGKFSMANSYYSLGCASECHIHSLFNGLAFSQSGYTQSFMWNESY